MASVTIRLTVDPVTRKKNVVISYESDSDALPIEHEEEHRKWADRLIEGGAIKAGELGKIIVEREGGATVGETATEAEGEKQKEPQKG